MEDDGLDYEVNDEGEEQIETATLVQCGSCFASLILDWVYILKIDYISVVVAVIILWNEWYADGLRFTIVYSIILLYNYLY